jgi:hypothetical protein
MIAVSTVARAMIAWRHSVARLFPDEYIYAALGRSLGHGHLEIRGQTAHFPAILEPLVAAPIWRVFPTETAHSLVQLENAFAVSLAAIPVYLLARWLGLRSGYSYACAAYALLVPSLVLVAFNLADPIAYPLALAAVVAGARSLDEPTGRRQLLFLLLAGLATLARVQYFVLVPAYLVGAVLVDRRRTWRAHRVTLIALAPVAAVALLAEVGYYSSGVHDVVSRGYVLWILRQMFLLTLATGVVMVPGAVAGLVSARGRRETGAAALVGAFALLLLLESSTVAARTFEFKERYLFALMPLVPIAFGVYLKNGRPRRGLVIALSAIVALAAARVPLSEFTAGTLAQDSQFLRAVNYLEGRLQVDSASLLVALLATAGAAAAVAIAFRGLVSAALAATLAVALAVTAAAVTVDLRSSRAVRASEPRDLTWVDEASRGVVTLVGTPDTPQKHPLDTLYWNPSVQRELLLDRAFPTDAFSAPKLRIGRDGTLLNATHEVLFDDYGSSAVLAHATRVASAERLTLWRALSRPRFRLIVEGRYYDSWLAPKGRVRAWPLTVGHGTIVSFRLSLPRRWKVQSVHVKLGAARFTLHPGAHVDLVCGSASGPFDIGFSSPNVVLGSDLRPLTAELTRLRTADVPAGAVTRATTSCSRTK